MDSTYSIVRDVKLPRSRQILPRVKAIQDHYHRLTGGWMSTATAIECLDWLRDERRRRAGDASNWPDWTDGHTYTTRR